MAKIDIGEHPTWYFGFFFFSMGRSRCLRLEPQDFETVVTMHSEFEVIVVSLELTYEAKISWTDYKRLPNSEDIWAPFCHSDPEVPQDANSKTDILQYSIFFLQRAHYSLIDSVPSRSFGFRLDSPWPCSAPLLTLNWDWKFRACLDCILTLVRVGQTEVRMQNVTKILFGLS